MKENLAIFENFRIRRVYGEKAEAWYFSVIDVVGALTDSYNPRDYWFKMKIRVKSEDGIELSTICRQLKLQAQDGKMRNTDTANIEGLLRIIQSIPSPKRLDGNSNRRLEKALSAGKTNCRQKKRRKNESWSDIK